MNWSSLLCDKRLGVKEHKDREEHRPPWQYDFDRIAFSSAFRRLQDKTQVFPLSSSDYVRTRLTHSIEAACVARSLGNLAGFFLKRSGLLTKIHPLEIGMIVSAATLAHDIGNPPFGHSGEAAIQRWFQESETVKEYCAFTPRQISDFVNFEGNAQGFRMLTRSRMRRDEGGLQLTAAVLGAFSKYPIESRLDHEDSIKPSGKKKFGFFQGEGDLFEEVASMLELVRIPGNRRAWARHPLAFLVEAADDICYRLVDLEDARQQKLLPTKKVLELLAAATGDTAALKKSRRESNERERINYLRSKAIGRAVEECASVFETNEQLMRDGKLDENLVKIASRNKSSCLSTFDTIFKAQKEHVFSNDRVLRVEVAGFQVIGGLLEAFFKAICDVANRKWDADAAPPKSAKLYKLIPREYVVIQRTRRPDFYEILLRIADYVCGMTDSYALNLYRQISGISLP